jgi:glycosyltransferase involved in cell wall biosynthesis
MPNKLSDGSPPTISIVTPAFNESSNLLALWKRLCVSMESAGAEWEWIVVDDHSTDTTFETISALSAANRHVHGYRFSRNFGSHLALTCGLENAHGRCAVVMAGDLQDPPELLPELIDKWRNGAQVVWAVRREREGETATTVRTANLFYFIVRHLAGLKNMSPTGADFFLIDRVVIDALNQFPERNVTLMALITWMGFRQDQVSYTKQARSHGRSGWSLEKKLKLAVDSITSFTYLPIRAMTYLGICVASCGFLYAILVITNTLRHHLVQGWASLMVIVLVLGGAQMLMLGVLGEYLWRAFDESRRRPRYIIERLCGSRVLTGVEQTRPESGLRAADGSE